MNTTQQPEALNLEEFRAKVTHAAREPLLARIAELEDVADMAIKRIADLEAQLSAIGAGGVEPLRNREASAALAVPDERKSFDAANLRDYFGGPLSYRERDIAFMAWKARASLAATQAAGELATLQAGLQAAAPNAPLYDPREVAFSAQPAAQGLEARGRDLANREQELHITIDVLGRMFQGRAVGNAADACDAARYRWLRSRDLETISQGGVFAGMTPENVILNGEDLDEAVDAAIAAQAKQGEQANG